MILLKDSTYDELLQFLDNCEGTYNLQLHIIIIACSVHTYTLIRRLGGGYQSVTNCTDLWINQVYHFFLFSILLI